MLRALGDALLGPACSACEAPLAFDAALPVCAACAAGWREARSGEPVPGLPQVRALWEYTGVARALILRAKESAAGAPAHALWVAARSLHPEALLPPPRALLVPAPPSRRRAQGVLADFLARQCAAHCGQRYRPWLRRLRKRPAQAGLAGAERRSNLRGAIGLTRRARAALALRSASAQPPIWLVDDVLTTGATLEECARALRAAGLRIVGALVLARVA